MLLVQAQQRYRERRKQKFSEMEDSLHALASQVDQMNSVQSQNSMLQVCTYLLHARIMVRNPQVHHMHFYVCRMPMQISIPAQRCRCC